VAATADTSYAAGDPVRLVVAATDEQALEVAATLDVSQVTVFDLAIDDLDAEDAMSLDLGEFV
jgi:hypothetical protein